MRTVFHERLSELACQVGQMCGRAGLAMQQATQALLRNGRPRHRQARELLRINGCLLAHLSLLLSDRSDYQSAGVAVATCRAR